MYVCLCVGHCDGICFPSWWTGNYHYIPLCEAKEVVREGERQEEYVLLCVCVCVCVCVRERGGGGRFCLQRNTIELRRPPEWGELRRTTGSINGYEYPSLPSSAEKKKRAAMGTKNEGVQKCPPPPAILFTFLPLPLLLCLFIPLLLFLLLLHLNLFLNTTPSTSTASHPVPPPSPLSVSLSLLLCSRLERSQLLRGLQCYAIAQAESWGGGVQGGGGWGGGGTE